MQVCNQHWNALAFRLAEEKYLASLHIFWFPKVTNANDTIPDRFAGYRALQHSMEWIGSQGA